MTRRYRILASAAGALLPHAAFAQVPPRTTAARPPSFSVLHVIEAADLQASPQGVTERQAVTFRFKMKNVGTTISSQIPWVLEVDGQPVGNGTHPGLKPGEGWEGTKGWTATPGAHTVRFVIDPAGTAWATGAPAAARSRQLSYSVAALPATEVRLIDWDAAKAVGMNYADGLQKPTDCTAFLRPINSPSYTDNSGSTGYTQYMGWIHVGMTCAYTGGRMNPVVFDNLVLRNGWRVKEVKLRVVWQSTGQPRADWQYVSPPPAAGSDRPRVALRMWSNLAGGVHLAVGVEIEGPRGTDPYR